MLPMVLASPAVGILIWEWIALMAPVSSVYGLGAKIPFNMIVAGLTLLALLFSSERKLPPASPVILLIIALAFWATVSTLLSSAPDISWIMWDRFCKGLLLALLVSAVMRNQIRIHAVLWIIAISLGYYGFRGGLYWLISGGRFHLTGPASTIIHDNNHLAVALIVLLPILNFLRLYGTHPLTRKAVVVVMIFSFLAIIGTYSRGGFLALAVMIGYYWISTSRKIRTVMIGAVLIIPIILSLPTSWTDRMNSIGDATSDNSFAARLDSWQLHFDIARENPIFGVGMYTSQQPEFIASFAPDAERAVAAHSIYFQVMADLGFGGFLIFMALWVFVWKNLSRTISSSRQSDTNKWKSDLAGMLKCSFVGYFVGGAALSMAYYDLMYILAVISTLIGTAVVDRETQLSTPDNFGH